MAKKKTCKSVWINKQTIMEVRDSGSAYWGQLSKAKTKRGTMSKALLAEMRCHGVKADVRRQSGYPPELHLVPIRGKKVKYPY